jgi:hypothetical protein
MPNIVSLLVYLLIFCIVAGLGYWIIGSFVPPPVQKYAFAIFYVVIAIFVIYFLLSLVGGAVSLPRLR